MGCTDITYQIHRMHVVVAAVAAFRRLWFFHLIVLQDLTEVGDITGCKSQGVQLGEFGVGGHPWQGGLEAGEGLAQHPHPGSLPGVRGVALNRLPVFVKLFFRLHLGCSLPLSRHGFPVKEEITNETTLFIM